MIDTYPLPLTGLRHFFWAAKLESFKLAAESLNVSEAAVSQQIRNLESTLGVRLFSRGHQQVKLTDKGQLLVPHVENAFVSFQKGIEAIAADPEPNRLTITTVPSFATNWLIRRLILFKQQHPQLSISIDTSIESHDFESGYFDLAVRYGKGVYKGVKSELLMSDPTVLVCHPSLLTKETLDREDILRLPLIIGTTDEVQSAMGHFREYYQICADDQHETLLLYDGALGVEAARSRQGITMQRLSLVVDLLRSGELVYATDYAYREYSFYAVAPESHFENAKVQKFLSWLKFEMNKTAEKIQPYLDKIKH